MTTLVHSVGRGFEIRMLRLTTWFLMQFSQLRPVGRRIIMIWLAAFGLSVIVSFAIKMLMTASLP
ncbi:MAG: hypothetical protein QF376_00340 [Anaerolineales bacterium]|jgi:hypothetical protein|nr:hypothetical protein [Anaerolineales bacterium]HJO33532.1 hypothetical protein [Anaerolineales bacterium]